MRRDVYIENDSGGFSVLATDAVDAIIEDGRSDDMQFVTGHKAMLLELYGDDSLPIRIVANEPLTSDEEAQWLARASWRIDTSDGRMLAMGGFDPDVLSWWKDEGGEGDGRGIAAFEVTPGSWRVDLYAHVGSMNGRAILDEARERPGAAFRRSHPARAFPLWLAHMLQFSGDDDPGHESLWRDVKGNMARGELSVDAEGPDPIGFLIHVMPFTGPDPAEPDDGGWFARDANSRLPAVFPLGIASHVSDPNLESFRNDVLDRRPPEPERPIADTVVEIIEVWSGDPLSKVDGGSVTIEPNEIYLLHWMAALTADSPPRFEILVEPKGAWTPPAPTPDYAVVPKGRTMTAIGPVKNTGGWHVWWTARSVAAALGPIPDGSSIDVAMAPRLDDDDELNPEVGRALYSGTMKDGRFEITHASPHIDRDTLAAAFAFVRELATNGRLSVRSGAERTAFDLQAEMFSPEEGSLVWEDDVVHLAEPDERTLILLASKVFRLRFGNQWTVDSDEADDEDDD
jgi:hypothetical protein